MIQNRGGLDMNPATQPTRLGYDTRSLRSALVMGAVDLLRPWHRPAAFHWAKTCVVSSVAGLGDLFIHLPLIAGIVTENRRQGIPTRVALRPSTLEIGRLCGWDTMPFDNALTEFFKASSSIKPWALLAHLREARRSAPELWLDLSGNAVNALLIKLAGARRLASRTTRGGRSVVDHALPHIPGENEYRNVRRVGEYLGRAPDYSIYRFLEGGSPAPGAAVLAVTTACRWRSWPLENFRELIQGFPERSFALTGFFREIPVEDRGAFDRIIALPNVVNLLDRLSMLDMIRLIANAPAVVTNDTSCAHIANAFRRPGAVIFGPENPNVFAAPDGLQLFHDASCPFFPCVQWKCSNPQHWCMSLVRPPAVIAFMRELDGH